MKVFEIAFKIFAGIVVIAASSAAAAAVTIFVVVVCFFVFVFVFVMLIRTAGRQAERINEEKKRVSSVFYRKCTVIH